MGNQQLAALMTEAGFLDRSGTIGRKRFARAVTEAATHCLKDDDDRWWATSLVVQSLDCADTGILIFVVGAVNVTGN